METQEAKNKAYWILVRNGQYWSSLDYREFGSRAFTKSYAEHDERDTYYCHVIAGSEQEAWQKAFRLVEELKK